MQLAADQAQRKPREKRRKRKNNSQNNNNAEIAISNDFRNMNISNSPQNRFHSHHHRPSLFVHKKIAVERCKIGLIIGQAGINIKHLQNITHCAIIIPNHSRKVSNEPSNINDVLAINMKKREEEEDKSNDETTDKYDPNELIKIRLRGTAEEVRDAEEEIIFIVKNGRLKLDQERNKSLKENCTSFEMAEDMLIPSKICGMLIGHQGGRIKQLCLQTACDIYIDWDQTSHAEAGVSVVHMKGSKNAIADAKLEIRRILKLFENGGGQLRYEIPQYCKRTLLENKASVLKLLQKQYSVNIDIRRWNKTSASADIIYDANVQRTIMIVLTGEEHKILACKTAIDSIFGVFCKCEQCKRLVNDDDGRLDDAKNYERHCNWYCNRCWDEFNGVSVELNDDQRNVGNEQRNQSFNSEGKQNVRESGAAHSFGVFGNGNGMVDAYESNSSVRKKPPISANKW